MSYIWFISLVVCQYQCNLRMTYACNDLFCLLTLLVPVTVMYVELSVKILIFSLVENVSQRVEFY